MQVTTSVTDASSAANDGAISISASGGQAGYQYEWVSGDLAGLDTTDVSGLAPGVYTVRVSDSRGCYTYERISVNTLANVNQVQNKDFKLYPNPASLEAFIHLDQFENAVDLQCVDMMGQSVLQLNNVQTNRIRLDLSQLPSGMYLVKITDGNQKFTKKLMVR